MQGPMTKTQAASQPEASRREEHEITQPLRIISSRTPHPSVPVVFQGSWFKKYEQAGVRRTPDFTEIGDPAA